MTRNLRWAIALPVLAAIACSDGSDDTGTDDTVTDDTMCNAQIASTFPANGETSAYYRTTFSVEFRQDEAATATFVLTDSADAEVALDTLNWSDDGRAVYFNAAAPLMPSSSYTLTISYSCDTVAPIEFTTSDVGAPVADTDFVGKTYAIDLNTAVIVEPPGVNDLLKSLLTQLDEGIAVVPQSYDMGTQEITFFGGLIAGDAGSYSQDLCTETLVFDEPASYAEDPYFEIDAPQGLTIAVDDFTITLLDLFLSGSFAPTGSSIVGVTLAGQIDTREIAGLLGDELGGDDSPEAVCNLVSTFTSGAVECSECPGGAGPYCLTLVATGLEAPLASGFDLAELGDSDIDTDCM